MDKELSPLLKGDGALPLDHLDEMMEDDTDGSESVSSINPVSKLKEEPAPLPPQTPSASTSQPNAVAGDTPVMTPKAVKSKSGYILFSAEVRKRIMHENPDAGFGEVSKIVGIEVSLVRGESYHFFLFSGRSSLRSRRSSTRCEQKWWRRKRPNKMRSRPHRP